MTSRMSRREAGAEGSFSKPFEMQFYKSAAADGVISLAYRLLYNNNNNNNTVS